MRDPDRIAHFHLVGRLGAGGMGVVYRARDEKLERDVALKVIQGDHAADPEWRRRLAKEAKAAAAVKHPGVPVIYEIGEDGEVLYISMELLSGRPLRFLMKELTIGEALEVAAEIADTLAAAHASGIVHRDVKPENVLITDDKQVKVLDFGIARRRVDASAPTMPSTPSSDATDTALSREGVVLGTPGYMSPEQAMGREVGPASDIFSLGVVLYEMLCHRLPFGGGSLLESVVAVSRDEPAPIEPRAGMPAAVTALVLRCLEKEPAARPASAVALGEALRELARNLARDETAKTALADTTTLAREPARRSFPGSLLLVAAAVCALGAGLYIGLTSKGTPTAPTAATSSAGSSSTTSSSPAPSSTAPSSAQPEIVNPTAVAITDLPVMGTDNLAAITAYKSALADLRRSDWSRAPGHLLEALEKDPDFALAVLRLGYLEGLNGDLTSARKRFQWLAEHPTKLDERHRAWQQAAEAIVLHDPADYRLAGTLFEQASARWPADAELHYMVAATYEHSYLFPEKVLAEARRAIEIDPEYADALQTLAHVLGRVGKAEEAATYLDRCVALHSTDCVFDRMRLNEYEGRCDAAVADAKLYASSGGGSNLHWLFAASAVLSQGDGKDAASAFLKLGEGATDARSQWVTRVGRLRMLATEGQFEELRREVQKLIAETSRFDLLSDLASLELGATRELGDDHAVEALATRFLGDRLASQGGYRQIPTVDPTPVFFRELARLGKLSADELDAKLERWRTGERAVGFDDGRIWFQSTALIAWTKEEEQRALASRPVGFVASDVRDAALGWDVLARLELAAGHGDAARDLLLKATKSCTALLHPFAYVRSYLELGAAYESLKDPTHACDAYRGVLRWWGSAKRSETAERARERIAALHCPT
ncbi:MAG: serine/threonine-protein kinase [Polyangiaceae bacterium]